MTHKITKIDKQARRDRYNIYLDGKYAFSLSAKVLAELCLKEGDELAAADISSAKKKDDENKTFGRALHILSYRNHSRKELLDKLMRKFDKNLAEIAVKRLEEMELINDEAFAVEYIQRSKKGKKAVYLELLKKGIARNLIEEALSEKSDDEEVENAKSLAEKIIKRNEKETSVVVKKKIYEGLSRRGFSYDVYKKIIHKVEVE